MKRKREDHAAELAKAAKGRGREHYVLRLFVAGITPRSERAIRSIKEICDRRLAGRYELEIVDVYQQPDAVRKEEIIVAPTLVKKLPLPLRRLIGDMSNEQKVLVGLNLSESHERKAQDGQGPAARV